MLEQHFDLVDQARAQVILTENMPDRFWRNQYRQPVVNLVLLDTYLDEKSERIDGVYEVEVDEWNLRKVWWINETWRDDHRVQVEGVSRWRGLDREIT